MASFHYGYLSVAKSLSERCLLECERFAAIGRFCFWAGIAKLFCDS
jgi:hypothetical protein